MSCTELRCWSCSGTLVNYLWWENPQEVLICLSKIFFLCPCLGWDITTLQDRWCSRALYPYLKLHPELDHWTRPWKWKLPMHQASLLKTNKSFISRQGWSRSWRKALNWLVCIRMDSSFHSRKLDDFELLDILLYL